MSKKLYDENGNVVKGAKVKKPFYKKWWFILLVVLVIGGALTGGDEDTSGEEATAEEPDTEVVADADEETTEEVVEEEPEEEIEEEPIVVTADEILNDYVENEVNANKVYKGELVQVTGRLNSISETDSGKVSIVISPESDELWLEDISVELEDSTGIENTSTDSEITVRGTADTGIFYKVVLKKANIIQ